MQMYGSAEDHFDPSFCFFFVGLQSVHIFCCPERTIFQKMKSVVSKLRNFGLSQGFNCVGRELCARNMYREIRIFQESASHHLVPIGRRLGDRTRGITSQGVQSKESKTEGPS